MHELMAEIDSSDKSFLDVDCLQYIPPIGQTLRDGAVARCSNVDCSEALFTEAFLWTLEMTVTNIEIPTRTVAAVLFFCSGRCSRLYAEANPRKVALRVQWSLL